MARMECRCGKLLDNRESPNGIELKIYDDKEWDEIFSEEAIDVLSIPLPKFNVWRCPDCKRLYFFEYGNSVPKMIYSLEY